MKDYSNAIELNPVCLEAFYHRGFVRYQLKQDKEALEDINKAISLKAATAEAYYCRGKAKRFSWRPRWSLYRYESGSFFWIAGRFRIS